MVFEFTTEQKPSIKQFVLSLSDEEGVRTTATNKEISGSFDIVEITPETNATISKHPGEDGRVFADTRIRNPARYRAVLAFPDTGVDMVSDAVRNLLDASAEKMCFYTVTSYFSRCYNMVVVSSSNHDTVEMQGLRLQTVVFEEVIPYDDDTQKAIGKCENPEDKATQSAPPQSVEDLFGVYDSVSLNEEDFSKANEGNAR